jgi:hypothetical protein
MEQTLARSRFDWVARFVLGIALMCGAAATAWGVQHFDSVYTDLDRDCRRLSAALDQSTGSDAPETCKPVAGYRVVKRYSAAATHLYADTVDGGFSVPLTANHPCFPEFGPRVEWRRINGRPFAAIARILCFRVDPAASGFSHLREKLAEYLIVRGLQGHEHITADIDVSQDRRANASARASANTSYRGR